MNINVKLKQLMLFLRYGQLSNSVIEAHLGPFTVVFAIWLVTFYIGGLYDLPSLKNDLRFSKKFVSLVAASGIVAIFFFYFIPAFGIAPKTNLFIVLAVVGLGGYAWRTFCNNILSAGAPTSRILMVGYNKTVEDLVNHIQQNPQLGYEVSFWMKEGLQDKELDHLSQIILQNKINVIVVPAHIKKNSKAARLIYKNLVLGIEVLDLAALFENLTKKHRVYEFFKKPIETLLAIVIGIIFLPVGLLITILVAATSRGPIIYRQKRSGLIGTGFMIYKFRTMKADAEQNGPQWSGPKDQRVTAIGKILRKSHLDELPQIINIIRGDLSFVGPRPERPELVSQIKNDVPYFELRLLTRPGITGWAQINYKYGASVEDAYEKLQYDLYYLKNRSLILDFLVLLRTIKYLFTTPQ